MQGGVVDITNCYIANCSAYCRNASAGAEREQQVVLSELYDLGQNPPGAYGGAISLKGIDNLRATVVLSRTTITGCVASDGAARDARLSAGGAIYVRHPCLNPLRHPRLNPRICSDRILCSCVRLYGLKPTA